MGGNYTLKHKNTKTVLLFDFKGGAFEFGKSLCKYCMRIKPHLLFYLAVRRLRSGQTR